MTSERLLERLTERVIGCAMSVHRELGPGLLESVYQACLRIELEANGFGVAAGGRVSLQYRGRTVPVDLVPT